MSVFYLIFWLNCIFIDAYLKASIEQINLSNLKEKSFKKISNDYLNNLAKKNLDQFNYILRLFNFIQNDADYTVATYYFGN